MIPVPKLSAKIITFTITVWAVAATPPLKGTMRLMLVSALATFVSLRTEIVPYTINDHPPRVRAECRRHSRVARIGGDAPWPYNAAEVVPATPWRHALLR